MRYYSDRHRQFIEILQNISFLDWQYTIKIDEGRPYLQIICDGTCNVTGKLMNWTSRKWKLSWHATKSEIVQTALKATLAAVEHEARENFLYRGRSIFDPHYNIDKLWELRGTNCLDERT